MLKKLFLCSTLTLNGLIACTPSLSPISTTPSVPPRIEIPTLPSAPPTVEVPANIKTQLLQHYKGWKGTQYVLGKQKKDGIDCSGYTQLTFRELFSIKLPRTVVQQRKFSKPIPSTQLKAGDLVFFNSSVPNHVGIALGDGHFIHVSSTNGVSISSLTTGYWQKKVEGGGRVLDSTKEK